MDRYAGLRDLMARTAASLGISVEKLEDSLEKIRTNPRPTAMDMEALPYPGRGPMITIDSLGYMPPMPNPQRWRPGEPRLPAFLRGRNERHQDAKRRERKNRR